MFSTKLNNDRYLVPCIIVGDVPSKNIMVVDTGAKYTCCSIYNINPNLDEEFFSNAEIKNIGGLVSGSSIKYYKFHTRQFTIGNVDLKDRDIWMLLFSRGLLSELPVLWYDFIADTERRTHA